MSNWIKVEDRLPEDNPALLLQSLRWDVDCLVYLHEYGKMYWLCEHINSKTGKRDGITSCCQKDYECSHHKKLRDSIDNQNPMLN